MKSSKTALWLSVIDALLVLVASFAGLFLESTYARETTSYALQSVGHDIENSVAAVALLITVYFVSKGSVKAFLAVPLLVFSILTGIGILAIFVVMSMKGMPMSLIVELLFAVIVVVSLVLSVLYVREVKEQMGVSFV